MPFPLHTFSTFFKIFKSHVVSPLSRLILSPLFPYKNSFTPFSLFHFNRFSHFSLFSHSSEFSLAPSVVISRCLLLFDALVSSLHDPLPGESLAFLVLLRSFSVYPLCSSSLPSFSFIPCDFPVSLVYPL